MKFLFYAIFVLIIITNTFCKFNNKDLSLLREQIKNHPIQTLQDVYKSCYQDEYGPGHLIADESSAMNYLFEEVNSIEEDYNPPTLFEQTGLEGNYIRVDLTLIKNGTIPFLVLFKGLLISAEIGAKKSDTNWAEIWNEIVEEIKKSDLKFENFENDVINLKNISESSDKVVHHSEIYEKAYHPHYRIIEKNVFEKYLKPFINNSI